ncbi:MAG: hypothetical protein V1861_06355 [Candidatus Micrarchaeota archaeon]
MKYPLLFLISLLIGCIAQSVLSPKDLTDAPEQYIGKDISVTGKVWGPPSYDKLRGNGFSLEGDGERIDVMGSNGASVGSECTVRGTFIRESYIFFYVNASSVDCEHQLIYNTGK